MAQKLPRIATPILTGVQHLEIVAKPPIFEKEILWFWFIMNSVIRVATHCCFYVFFHIWPYVKKRVANRSEAGKFWYKNNLTSPSQTTRAADQNHRIAFSLPNTCVTLENPQDPK